MFNNPKYLTKGVQDTIPSWLVILLWHLIEIMPVERKDCLQVFRLRQTANGQHITHTQEQPPYQYDLDIPFPMR